MSKKEELWHQGHYEVVTKLLNEDFSTPIQGIKMSKKELEKVLMYIAACFNYGSYQSAGLSSPSGKVMQLLCKYGV